MVKENVIKENAIFHFLQDVLKNKFFIVIIVLFSLFLSFVFNIFFKTKYDVEILFIPQTRDYISKLKPYFDNNILVNPSSDAGTQVILPRPSSFTSRIILDDFVSQFETYKRIGEAVLEEHSAFNNFQGTQELKNKLRNDIAKSFKISLPFKQERYYRISFVTYNVEESIKILNKALLNIFQDITVINETSNLAEKRKILQILEDYNVFNNSALGIMNNNLLKKIDRRLIFLNEQLDIANLKKIEDDVDFKNTILSNGFAGGSIDKFYYFKGKSLIKKEIDQLIERRKLLVSKPLSILDKEVGTKDKATSIAESVSFADINISYIQEILQSEKLQTIIPIIIDTSFHSIKVKIKPSTIYLLFGFIGLILGIFLSIFISKFNLYNRKR